ncbi:MAG TPA: DUF87 domain-containing protein [Kiritimatiellia bacterium]|nr:DUF87 domain-containing protein [Kiritimatiellia bacterium]
MADYEKLGAFYLGRLFDTGAGKTTDDYLLYDAKDLTTHAVCVGMTGSGKTGLCVSLIEEAAIDGIPAIVIDPKGDLGNLLLAFPELNAGDFEPWVDAQEAARKGMSPSEFAKATADLWRKGLASWDQQPERIARLKEAAEFAIYTPGSTSGRPLTVLRSFEAPDPAFRNDVTAMRERIMTAVSGLLGLLGITADPISSREHILLSNLFDSAWNQGKDLELPDLIQLIQRPPFDRVGVFDLETFYPAKDRLGLAMMINNLLASPGFSAWITGEPLDVQRLLYTPEGKARVSILSIAHLSDAERMFFVTLLLNEVLGWMRSQSGTSSLRALLYMDEIFGYFPPTANPPSKMPMLTLLKQARAFGLGVVLATQNPVDLDYKGLSNTGTWFIGRLQTERDKARIMEGLESAAGGAMMSRSEMDAVLSNLGSRVFLMRNVHDTQPVLFQTRWAMTYLRGPMTMAQIERFSPRRPTPVPAESGRGESSPGSAAAVPQVSPGGSAPVGVKPVVPAELNEYFIRSSSYADPQRLLYRPRMMGIARLRFVHARSKVDLWQTRTFLAPFGFEGAEVRWKDADILIDEEADLERRPLEGVGYAELPSGVSNAKNLRDWGKALESYLYQDVTMDLLECPEFKLFSRAGEEAGDFQARIAQLARERRDGDLEKLKSKYETQLARLQERIRVASQRVGRQRDMVSQQKMQTAMNFGTTLLGALLGRKAVSVGNVSRASSTMRSAGRVAGKKADVERAEDTLETLQQQLQELEERFEQERMELVKGQPEPHVETISIRPRKSDLSVTQLGLVWMPWQQSADGVWESAVR